jgi:hypothetical protein
VGQRIHEVQQSRAERNSPHLCRKIAEGRELEQRDLTSARGPQPTLRHQEDLRTQTPRVYCTLSARLQDAKQGGTVSLPSSCCSLGIPSILAPPLRLPKAARPSQFHGLVVEHAPGTKRARRERGSWAGANGGRGILEATTRRGEVRRDRRLEETIHVDSLYTSSRYAEERWAGEVRRTSKKH